MLLAGSSAVPDSQFRVGDRVKNIRPTREGEPNNLPAATVIQISGKRPTVWIKYDDDTDDTGWPETAETLEKINA
jgi:hypothetical protein